jgi:hypothetical protein
VVPVFKLRDIDLAEQARQQLVQHASGVLRRHVVAGFERDDSDPGDGWPPRAQKIGMGTRQGSSYSIA